MLRERELIFEFDKEMWFFREPKKKLVCSPIVRICARSLLLDFGSKIFLNPIYGNVQNLKTYFCDFSKPPQHSESLWGTMKMRKLGTKKK